MQKLRTNVVKNYFIFKDSGTRNDQAILPRNSSGGTRDTGSLLLGTSCPPVPCKLVKKITDGEFVEMSELLPDRLASSGDKELSKSSKKRRVVTDIVEWVQYFGLYIAIISRRECRTYWATRLLLLMPTWSTKDCTGQIQAANAVQQ